MPREKTVRGRVAKARRCKTRTGVFCCTYKTFSLRTQKPFLNRRLFSINILHINISYMILYSYTLYFILIIERNSTLND